MSERPKALRDDAISTTFENGESERRGSLVSVYPFEIQEGADSQAGGDGCVVKKYMFHGKGMERDLFPDATVSLQEKAAFFKDNYEYTRNFFEEIPNLVEPTQIFLSENDRGEAGIYEVQRKVDGLSLTEVYDDGLDELYKYLTDGQIRQLVGPLRRIAILIEEGMRQNKKIPDPNLKNVIVGKDGALHLIDTNVLFAIYTRDREAYYYLPRNMKKFKRIADRIESLSI